ncbi:hypothetical protein [Thiocystis violacea]|uniref:COG4648 family protein n=1 Tax=Thiocystis violacea TaxID=13725 RepID=UPI0019051387|nr:hypothetical protein [Thiocystis violacea]MBK1723549.1 hypothetical protein [Thiocystis violacea]
MRQATCVLRWLAIAALSGIYVWLAYRTTASAQPTHLGALLAILPVALFALALAWKAARRIIAMATWSAAVVLLLLAWPVIEARFAWIYFIQHAGIFTLLAIGFGRTLAAGAEPMITRFARLAHDGRLAPEVVRYTRSVTILWTLFFAGMAAVSGILFGLGDLAHWSFFANLLTPTLVIATFAGEFIVRLRVLPAEIRTGFIESIRASIVAARGSAPPAC